MRTRSASRDELACSDVGRAFRRRRLRAHSSCSYIFWEFGIRLPCDSDELHATGVLYPTPPMKPSPTETASSPRDLRTVNDITLHNLPWFDSDAPWTSHLTHDAVQ